jgi:hypothetical protein
VNRGATDNAFSGGKSRLGMSDFYCLAPRLLSISALLSEHLMHERNRD